jgi:hypothetical protein
LVNWVLTTNTEHVPTQYQTDFLEHNAVNHAILEMAKNANSIFPQEPN